MSHLLHQGCSCGRVSDAIALHRGVHEPDDDAIGVKQRRYLIKQSQGSGHLVSLDLKAHDMALMEHKARVVHHRSSRLVWYLTQDSNSKTQDSNSNVVLW